ncbi:MAG: hypothetical protein WCF85_21580 [Rhodospirillaceae bacterium]
MNRSKQSSARLREDAVLDTFAKTLFERFEWKEYPLLLHWCKVLNMTDLRERLLDLAFSTEPPPEALLRPTKGKKS